MDTQLALARAEAAAKVQQDFLRQEQTRALHKFHQFQMERSLELRVGNTRLIGAGGRLFNNIGTFQNYLPVGRIVTVNSGIPLRHRLGTDIPVPRGNNRRGRGGIHSRLGFRNGIQKTTGCIYKNRSVCGAVGRVKRDPIHRGISTSLSDNNKMKGNMQLTKCGENDGGMPVNVVDNEIDKFIAGKKKNAYDLDKELADYMEAAKLAKAKASEDKKKSDPNPNSTQLTPNFESFDVDYEFGDIYFDEDDVTIEDQEIDDDDDDRASIDSAATVARQPL